MKKKLNQTQALSQWMTNGQWISLKNAGKHLGISRLPEIIRRLKDECLSFYGVSLIRSETETIETRYGKTHIVKWQVIPGQMTRFKRFVKHFCKPAH